MRARRDCFGAFGPLASLTLGSPSGRPPSPLRGAVVELGLLFVGSSNQNADRFVPCFVLNSQIGGAPGEIRTPDLLVRSRSDDLIGSCFSTT